MKLTVKTLKGRHFEIRVQPSDTIMAVKKKIEDIQGKDSYPCGQQLLIHNGKVLKDESTLSENTISEDGFLVVMLSKSKASGSSATSSGPDRPAASSVAPSSVPTPAPEAPSAPAPESVVSASNPATVSTPSNTYGEAASTLVAPTNLEQTVQHILDMGGGMWNKETVERALRAAYNNPERAVDYLYSGIPVMAEVAVPVAQTGIDSSTNLNPPPLNLFPQDNVPGDAVAGQGPLDFLRTNPQFQALRTMVHSDPEILQPMLQELGQENPELLRVIQEHHQEFLQLINEPVAEGLEGLEGDMVETDDLDLPHAISVTPEDEAIIERLEAMGFARELVVEAFLACDRNEELAINYLLENSYDD